MALFHNWKSMDLNLGWLEGVLCLLGCSCTICHQEGKSVNPLGPAEARALLLENAHLKSTPNRVSAIHSSRPLSPALCPNLSSFHTQQALFSLNRVRSKQWAAPALNVDGECLGETQPSSLLGWSWNLASHAIGEQTQDLRGPSVWSLATPTLGMVLSV